MLQTFYEECLTTINAEAKSAWPAIARAYDGRPYHNLDHLMEMLGHYRSIAPDLIPASPPIFGIALIYHDIVYRAGRADNEAHSADMAVAALQTAGVDTDGQNYCRALIMATKTHQPGNDDEGLLVDLDLAVLARPTKGYDAYTEAIRKEFSLFPSFLYRPGRKKALQHFLEKTNIYCEPSFRERWELLARENILREIERL
ncbi:MAG: putative metal-dependent HD superfamily phosphohydrolase [Neolewinella sp.]|jgi:predicted metal-dependent HD superfamily phosphohydrolase